MAELLGQRFSTALEGRTALLAVKGLLEEEVFPPLQY